MAKLANIIGTTFDAAAVEPSAGFSTDTLPPGVYTLEIVDADVAPTKKGNGQLLKISFSVIDPEPYARRRVWENLCISHENPETERIAQAKLSALCRAVGVATLEDTDNLIGLIVRGRIKIKPASGGYSESNEVVAYESAAAATRPAAPQAPAAPAGKAKPWSRAAA